MEAEPPEFRSQAEPGNEKTIKDCNAYFHARGLRLVEPTARRGGYGVFAPAMLVYYAVVLIIILRTYRLIKRFEG